MKISGHPNVPVDWGRLGNRDARKIACPDAAWVSGVFGLGEILQKTDYEFLENVTK